MQYNQDRMNLISVLVVVIQLTSLVTASGDVEWTYGDGPMGPAHWKDHFEKCGGTSQSPINIDTKQVSFQNSLSGITFTNYNHPTESARPRMKNNGHTIQVDLIGGEYTIEDAGLPGRYKAAQFHLHWGSVNDRGSEHTMNSRAYPLELHIVHYSLKYNDLLEAADKPEGLAVLGILFEVSSYDNNAFNNIIGNLRNASYKGTSVEIPNFALEEFLPVDTKYYYRYPGSLTTPGCYESVIWTVLQTTSHISQEQLDEIRKVYENEAGEDHNSFLVDNYRPVLPLNSRTVKSSNPDHDTNSSPALLPSFLLITFPAFIQSLIMCLK